MKKRIVSGAERIIGYKNKATEFWEVTKYKEDYKLFCTIVALDNKNLPLRGCDMIEGWNGKEDYIQQFEINFSKKKILELYKMLKYKIDLWKLK